MNIFLISDTHFAHENCYSFINYDGTKMRPWDNCDEADEIMIERWNEIVRPGDRIYLLGDLGFNKLKTESILKRLKGRKVLIKGNHDKFSLTFYKQHFDHVRACFNRDNYLLTHIPIHPSCKNRFIRNIHGHCHYNKITKLNEEGKEVIDLYYKNVCVECTNYTPIEFSVIKEETKKLIEQGLI